MGATNAKTAGAIQHVISQLVIKGLITPDDSDHLKKTIEIYPNLKTSSDDR